MRQPTSSRLAWRTMGSPAAADAVPVANVVVVEDAAVATLPLSVLTRRTGLSRSALCVLATASCIPPAPTVSLALRSAIVALAFPESSTLAYRLYSGNHRSSAACQDEGDLMYPSCVPHTKVKRSRLETRTRSSSESCDGPMSLKRVRRRYTPQSFLNDTRQFIVSRCKWLHSLRLRLLVLSAPCSRSSALATISYLFHPTARR